MTSASLPNCFRCGKQPCECRQQILPGVDLSLDAYVADAVKLLRQMQPIDQPYYGCFSGGKDSCVIKELGRLAEVNVTWHYNVTTIDPPELVRFIRKEHADVVWHRPECNFFTYAIRYKKGFPTRRMRWCCEKFKEQRSPKGSRLILGVRAEESPRRAANWREVTWHHQTGEYAVCPIVKWTKEHVWAFIGGVGLPYCSLYDEGFDRLGCIGCPIARTANRLKEFVRWPGYERKWKQLFRDTWDMRTGKPQRNGKQWFGDRFFANWEAMWEWWLSDEPLPTDKCQGLVELFS